MLYIAIIALCIAHYIRAVRWELFVKTYEEPDRGSLLRALSIGYFINFFVPFKAGDLVRAWLAGKRMRNGRGFALATVIVDRYLDILIMGIFFSVFYMLDIGKDSNSAGFYICSACVLLVMSMAVYYFRRIVKLGLKHAAGIFSPGIEVKILRFCWSLIWSFKDIFGRISRKALLGTTLGMWFLYLVSYYFFAGFISGKGQALAWTDVFLLLFAKNSMQDGSISFFAGNGFRGDQAGWLAVYLAVPVIMLFLSSLFLRIRPGSGEESRQAYLNLIPYMHEKERLNFLEAYFSNEYQDSIDRYLQINQNVLIIRNCSAGSNAVTMLCMDDGKSFFRKYAFGSDGEKLNKQAEWLERFQNQLPLPKIIRHEKAEGFCYYDMPYDRNAVGMFEYAHSMPKEKAWEIMQRAVDCMEGSLYQKSLRKADSASIDRYIKEKVEKNLERILNAKYISRLMKYEQIVINGRNYKNLPFYFGYLDRQNLYEVFKNDMYCEIHGDLTVENIICTGSSVEDGKDNFYFIDPNTGNIHESPGLDYGKLLQSVHGGYEFLMATKHLQAEGNRINFMFARSEAYTYLYQSLDAYLCQKFSWKQVRSIYYHEIIHWLRLMPYKIEKNGQRSLLFYAGMLMVMNDVIRKFEGEGQAQKELSVLNLDKRLYRTVK